MLNVGDKVPDFLGKDETGREVRVSDFAGKRLVVYFYPKDSTPGCTAEACSLRDGLDELAAAGYAVVGVSADSEASHQRFKLKQQLNFPLIADVDKALIKQFGAWGEKKMAGRVYDGILRTTFVISADDCTVERVITKVDTKNAARQLLQG
ncbi:MAG: thioredoxin-dependent thiol peroxidase [Bacteroidaceae bacterium]|jgi:peroxiredoxin Q/BCP|nr:thioredoxin-dependent thiol peroxidase [Bacteroidaceae bacterium]MBQ5817747.1 thioredoxin-dependent thiol peroxidase [Bacteroidaceae bacterium]MBR5512259.1 thioredoxin-dependent thiol peroxidase [Bacteroidaceae bacterium]MBR5847891.1 thioredoxin-dependent thiol peroxidase [Bacteroidaceae bacterium]